MRRATAVVSSGATVCMSASLLAIVTESCPAAGRSVTRSRICVRERELAAEVVRLLGGDAEVGADGGDAVVLAQAGACGPAVAELLLLVCECEVLALVLLRLDAADLVRAGFVVEQQHDQAAHGREALETVGAGELVAGLGGEQPSLAGVEDRVRLVGVGAVADAGTSWPVRQSIPARRSIAVLGDLPALVGGEV